MSVQIGASDSLQPVDCSPPGSSVNGILWAGTLEWVAVCRPCQTPGDGDGQGSLACCSLWGRKESDLTERLNDLTK